MTRRIKPLFEIFKEVSEQRLKKDRIDALRFYKSPLMEYIVKAAYHPAVTWLLPPGKPPFKAMGNSDEFGANLYKEMDRLYLFFAFGGIPAHHELKQFDRERLFISLLEKIHPEDARILLGAKDDHKIVYPFLTYALFKEAFPDWLPSLENNTEE